MMDTSAAILDTGICINHADSNRCRGPEQLARGQADRSGAAPISETGRKMLTDLMREGLGDHVLLLRLYQASGSCMEECLWLRALVHWSSSSGFLVSSPEQMLLQIPVRVLPGGTVGTDTMLIIQG